MNLRDIIVNKKKPDIPHGSIKEGKEESKLIKQ